ncbi:alpha/beta hydrolase [Lacticaseibacillus zhaodongensis]|uniref:alpha/beta hydrolase n=1 Tax=Lacticaseibacillus zhaodongensis TaxID=2668065 RepID=UPI0012D2B62F|nr:alpha/beta hydrolase [Lacticaseibacillus zhaodongensis]
MRKIFLALICALTLTVVAVPETTVAAASTNGYSRPTVLVHGYKAGSGAFDNFINETQVNGQTTFALRVIIDRGHMVVQGHMLPHMHHPLVQVVFTQNREPWNQNAIWLNRALCMLRRRYGIRSFDAITHSRGCMDLLVAYAHKQPLRLHKAVLIAGPYDGALWRDDRLGANHLNAQDVPAIKHREYRELQHLAPDFPKGVQVLNVMGNKGDRSDGVVTNVSTLSLKSALGSRFRAYKVATFHGPLAVHHALPRRNPYVWATTVHFLWPGDHGHHRLQHVAAAFNHDYILKHKYGETMKTKSKKYQDAVMHE